jgi:thiosulfate reductase cytochrome b subunit
MKKVYIYKAYERFWHWSQAFLVFFLAFTGFEIHGSFVFFGYQNAVTYHNMAAIIFLVLIAFTIFWHFATGEWKQYKPTLKNIKVQIQYYITGIFKQAPHPTRKTELSKLNPLQKLVYFGLKVFLIPILSLSGLFYMFYRYQQNGQIKSLNIDGLGGIASIHTLAALLMIAFVIVHLYLITTGTSVFSNLKAMLTGYEELEDDEDKKDENES